MSIVRSMRSVRALSLWLLALALAVLSSAPFDVSAQAAAGKGNRVTAHEFSLASSNDDPWGIASNGVNVWIGELPDEKLYAYNLATGARVSSLDKNTPTNDRAQSPTGIHLLLKGAKKGHLLLTSDEATHSLTKNWDRFVWISDFSQTTLSSGDGFQVVNTHGLSPLAHPHPQGIWSDGTTIYVSDRAGGTIGDHSGAGVFAYALDGTRQSNKDFTGMGSDGMKHIVGIWSDGVTMWMADTHADKVFAYKISDQSRDTSKEFNLHSDNPSPRGIWSDGVTMWVVDPDKDKVFAYDISGLTVTKNERAPDTKSTLGLWSDSVRIFVGDPEADKVRAYDARNHYHLARYDVGLDTAQGNTNLGGIWYNESSKILYVANQTPSKRVYAYELGSGTPTWNSNYDIAALDDVSLPKGVWSDGEIMWVVDAMNYNVAAYELPTLTKRGVRRRQDRDIKLPDSMESPYGAHSDGYILWVIDDTELNTNDRLYAFRLSNGEREPTKDVRLWSANSKPRGVSSRSGDNKKLMVVDAASDKAFHYYAVPEAPVISMNLSPVELSEDGGTHSMVAEITVEEMFGGPLSYDMTVDVLVSPVTATVDTADADYRASPAENPEPTKFVGQANIPAGSTKATVRFSIEVFDDDITEHTEHLLVFAEDSRSVLGNAKGSINKHESSVLVPILDNDTGPCSPATITRPSQRDMGISADPNHDLSGLASTGEGEHRGELTELCVSSPHVRQNTYIQSYKFIVPAQEGVDAQDRRRVRLVVHSDLSTSRCTLSGRCVEQFDPHLVLLRGGEIEDATIIGDYSDIDMRTGNLSAGTLVDLYPGNYIAYVTSHSQRQTGGYTFMYHLEAPGGPALTLPERRDNVLWNQNLANTPYVYKPSKYRTDRPPIFVVYAPDGGDSAAENRLDKGNYLISRADLSYFFVGHGLISYLAGPPDDTARLPRWYRIDGESHDGRTWGGLRWLEAALAAQSEGDGDGGAGGASGQGEPSQQGVQGASEPDQQVIDDVWTYARETGNGFEHVLRWTRVLMTLGAVSDMTAAEAQGYADRGWTRWDPVAQETEKLEAAPGTYDPDQQVIDDVWTYARETDNGFEHVLRWIRVLKTLGAVSDMTAAEAQGYADRGWKRWDPVVKALE